MQTPVHKNKFILHHSLPNTALNTWPESHVLWRHQAPSSGMTSRVSRGKTRMSDLCEPEDMWYHKEHQPSGTALP